MVHSACSVYMALPSPSSAITLRSGQAMAAPTATRHAVADRAAAVVDPVVRRRAGGLGEELAARGHALVDDDRVLGQHGPEDGGDRGRRDGAGRKRGPARRRDAGRCRAHGAELDRPAPRARRAYRLRGRPAWWTWRPSASAGWACRDRRRTRPARARPPAPGCRPPASRPAPFRRHRECARPARGRRPRSSRVLAPSVRIPHPVLAAIRPASSRQRWRRASPPISRVARSPLRSIAAAALTASSDTFGGGCGRRRLGDAVGRAPGRVRRQDQGRDLPGRLPRRLRSPARRRPRSCCELGEVLTQCDMGARHAFDVGGQRRVVGDVIGRVLADDVDDARVAPSWRCADWRGRWRGPGPDAAGSRPACPACGSSRRPRRSPRPRTGPARSACPAPCPARRRNAFPRCPDW